MKTKQIKIFETVSFHLVKPCNMSCKFCYATYNSFRVGKQLSLDDVVIILYKLYEAGVQKVTFAGGEPMLHKNIDEIIIAAKKIGRFYENWGADTKKSDSLVTHSVEHCLTQISLDRDKFIARGGIYNWD